MVESMSRIRKGRADGATGWLWPGQSTSEVGLHVVTGGGPHRWPVPGAHRCVVEAVDIDRDAGLAAVLILTLPSRGAATVYQETYEHDAVRGWISAGGASASGGSWARTHARPSAARSGPSVVMSVGGSSGGQSYLDRMRLTEEGRGLEERATVNWVNATVIDVSVEVDHLLLAKRRIKAPPHGRCVVVWKSAAPTGVDRPLRPRLAAVDRNGRILTELGPHDILDTFTQAFLDELA